MKTEIIEFNATDGIILNGYINRCDIQTDKVLIQIHGMTSNCFKKRDKVISKKMEDLNIDTICFNNRGSDIIRYAKKQKGEEKVSVLAGTAYEDVEDSYYDIRGAIEYAVQLGYTTIYLQGHSLGSTKIVYTYNKMKKEESKYLKYIKGVILLSLIDIPDIINTYAKQEYLEYANKMEKENKLLELMPTDSFIHLISIKTFLRYIKYNANIDFAKYSVEEDSFEELNNIEVPLFMRWGNINEMIKRPAEEQVEFVKVKINNNYKDINYIDGANHSYNNKEEILSNEIYRFLKEVTK